MNGLAGWYKRLAGKLFGVAVYDSGLALLREGAAYLYLLYLIWNKQIAVADFVLYFSVITGFSAWLSNIFSQIASLNRINLKINYFRSYLEYPETFRRDNGLKIPADDCPKVIELKNVSYKYEGAEHYALHSINLTIVPGEHIAVVGPNGAGKTTLVKLICGLIDPTEGQVLYDGIDIREYDRIEFYKLFSAPVILLDEPTAALDPIAESALYGNYNRISAEKTAVFISHRLAGTSFCDRIILLENGMICEEGTHKELLGLNGKKVGEKLAVVGMNGSGKTTFIKLMCRLYDPTEGEILLNGVNIQKYDYDEYMSIFSVVFQDFRLFSFSLGQNVSASVAYDSEKVRECLKKAGFEERLESMPNDLETFLYKDFDTDGVEISGGEAQKLALARALYKDAPFIILDEPTAALDPLSEYEVYSKFNEIAGDKTAIYISHRLASCRFCDKIAVFHAGEIVQKGTHEELLADHKGKYYELWNAQSQYYTTQNQ